MKNLKLFIAPAFFFLMAANLFAQNETPSCMAKTELRCTAKTVNPFSNCAAVFLDNKILADEYSTNGKCVVQQGTKGKLMVSTVDFSFDSVEPYKTVGFKIAIKNEKTNTLWLYSEKTFYEINLEDILATCEPGDKIILLTVDKEYSLPQNEIAVNWGC